MADRLLPSFGDISSVSEDASGILNSSLGVNGHVNVNATTGTRSTANDIDSQETIFDDESQSDSQSQSLLANASQSLFAFPVPPPQVVNGNKSNAAPAKLQKPVISMEFDELELDHESDPEQLPQFPDSLISQLMDEIDLEPEAESLELENSNTIQGQDAQAEDEDEGTQNDERLHRLPLAKLKRIIRTDEDVQKVAQEALITISIATEHFVSLLTQQSYRIAVAGKKKTIQLNHVKAVIESSGMFDFLEGCIPEYDI